MNQYKYINCNHHDQYDINDLIKIINVNLDILCHNYVSIYSDEHILLLKNDYEQQLDDLYKHKRVPNAKIDFLKATKIIEYNNDIVGYFTVYDRDLYMYIDDIKIVSMYQKNGIGTYVMKTIIYESTKILVLDVNKLNNVALNMYKKFGFELLQEEYIVNTNESRIIMYKINNKSILDESILKHIKNKKIADL